MVAQLAQPLTPSSIVANPQSFVGASDVPLIVANYDILLCSVQGLSDP